MKKAASPIYADDSVHIKLAKRVFISLKKALPGYLRHRTSLHPNQALKKGFCNAMVSETYAAHRLLGVENDLLSASEETRHLAKIKSIQSLLAGLQSKKTHDTNTKEKGNGRGRAVLTVLWQ